MRHRKETKGVQIEQKVIKLTLLSDDMSGLQKVQKNTHTHKKKVLELISNLARLQDTILIQNSPLLSYTWIISKWNWKLKTQ